MCAHQTIARIDIARHKSKPRVTTRLKRQAWLRQAARVVDIRFNDERHRFRSHIYRIFKIVTIGVALG